LGGEITKTPEKATTSVPEQTDVVNQQPEQPHQPSPKQTIISTPTPTQPEKSTFSTKGYSRTCC